MHLNPHGSPVADDSTLCTQWQGGPRPAEALPHVPSTAPHRMVERPLIG